MVCAAVNEIVCLCCCSILLGAVTTEKADCLRAIRAEWEVVNSDTWRDGAPRESEGNGAEFPVSSHSVGLVDVRAQLICLMDTVYFAAPATRSSAEPCNRHNRISGADRGCGGSRSLGGVGEGQERTAAPRLHRTVQFFSDCLRK